MDLLIILKYLIFFFLVSYQENFQLVKHLSKISILINIKLKKLQNLVQAFWLIFYHFALKACDTLKMFLLSAQNNFILYGVHIYSLQISLQQLPMEICIFSNVCQQIIAKIKMPQQHLCQVLDRLLQKVKYSLFLYPFEQTPIIAIDNNKRKKQVKG